MPDAPVEVAPPALPDGYRWASCAKALSWDAARYRHAVRSGALDTACGHSATYADVWRGNTTKPVCPECTKRLKEGRPHA